MKEKPGSSKSKKTHHHHHAGGHSKSRSTSPSKVAKGKPQPKPAEGVKKKVPIKEPKATSPSKNDKRPLDPSVPPVSSAADNQASGTTQANDKNEADVHDSVQGEVNNKIVLTNQSYLLLIFILVMLLSVGGLVYAFRFKDFNGEPPTVYCNIAFWFTVKALIALFTAALIGFIILSYRISNILIGFLFMFLIVVCFMHPAKAIANGINSLYYDTDATISVYARSPHDKEKLHQFWAVEQTRFNCCGTRDIDRIEDWSYWLNSSNLPASCCTKEHIEALKKRYGASNLPDNDPLVKNLTASCGYGLARTRTRGANFRPWWIFKRVYSGFYVSLTMAEKELFKNKYKAIIDPESYLVGKWNIANQDVEMLSPTDAFRYTWKAYYLDQLCNAMYYRNEVQYQGKPPRIGVGKPDSHGYYACADRPEVFENDMIYPGSSNIRKTAETLGWIQGVKTVRTRCTTEGGGLIHDIEKEREKLRRGADSEDTTTELTETTTKNECLTYICPELCCSFTRTATTKEEEKEEDEREQKKCNETNYVNYTLCMTCCLQNGTNGGSSVEATDGETLELDNKESRKNLTGEELCNITYPQTRQNATVLGRELLLVLDYLTSYIYEFGEQPTSSSKKTKPANVGKGTWIMWPIPTKFHPGERHPFKLAANLNRIKNLSDEAEANRFAKKMYYMSRGIAENVILKDIIHEKTCESLDTSDEAKQKYKEKLAQDVNRRFRLFGRDVAALNYNNRKGLGFWFLDALHYTAWLCIAASSGCIFLTIVIAVVFWQYFARIKAEEYANLALPKEFAVLNLRRGSMVDADDITMDRKKKQEHEHHLRSAQEGQGKGTEPRARKSHSHRAKQK